MDNSLRLRLVVRRNGLPEVRILFNLPLADDPNIANLLDHVNDTVPLEDARGEWGLEDYAVELHDKSGHAFECLHFQPVAGLLDKDDEVFIRPLMSVDLRKRRLGGRDQIVAGGEHLIDGVPFGRPRLRIPRARPPVSIAPRKRRRLTYDLDEDINLDDSDDEFVDANAGHDSDGEDVDLQWRQEGQDGQAHLLLTQHGEKGSRAGSRRVRFSGSLDTNPEVVITNAGQQDGGETDLGEDEDEDEQEDVNFEELTDELNDLKALAEEEEVEEEARLKGSSRVDEEHEGFHTPTEGLDNETVLELGGAYRHRRAAPIRTAETSSPQGKLKQKATTTDSTSLAERRVQSELGNPTQAGVNLLDPALQDKVTAIRFAFPQVTAVDCGTLLVKQNMDVSKTWQTLAKSLKPRQGLAETMVISTQLELPRQIRIVSSPPQSPAQLLGEVSRIESDDEDDLSSSEEDENDESDGLPDNDNESSDDSSADSESDSQSEGTREKSPARSSRPVKRSPHMSASTSPATSSSESDSESDSEAEASVDVQMLQARSRSQAADERQQHTRDISSRSGGTSGISSDTSAAEDPINRRAYGLRGRNVINSSSRNRNDNAVSKTIMTKRKDISSSLDDSEESFSLTSSSDSSSESDFEPTRKAAQPIKTKVTTPSLPRTTLRNLTEPNALVAPSQSPTLIPVPPGQGQTRTKRRNQRRRLENQRKKAALEAALASQHTSQGAQETSVKEVHLAAKKKALLQTLGTGLSTLNDGFGTDSAPTTSRPMTTKPDAWRQKISYRAVECVQEGIVLSEPPFPFVQRWDPQQRWDNQISSQRGSKRKSRDNAQFYGGESLNNIKKPKLSQDYYRPEDTTTFLTGQEDVTLNYDDVPIQPEDDNRADDDIPPLPADTSSLPELHKGNLTTGSIVAWKQLLCTEATNWQPQLSGFMTGVVTEIHADGEHFQVRLAKRDRSVDRNEKKFDEETGQRIYGKFEVPDEDEDDDDYEEDLGIRDVCLSQMLDARIVKQASKASQARASNELPGEDGPPERRNSEPALAAAYRQHGPDIEVADSQPEQSLRKSTGSSKCSGSNEQSAIYDHEANGLEVEQDPETSRALEVEMAGNSANAEESFVAETNRDVAVDDSNDDDGCAHAGSTSNVMDISQTRRDEISQLINEGGFRPNVGSPIDRSTFLQFGSPSRQLEEESASAVRPSYRTGSMRKESSEAPSEYGSKDPSQQDLGHIDVAAATTGDSTGEITYPKLQVSQDTETSAQNGRQLDPNLITHSDNLGVNSSNESLMIGGFGEETAVGEATKSDGRGCEKNPTRQIYNDGLQDARMTTTEIAFFKPTRMSPAASDSGSANSTRSSSIFPDVEFIGSQPAKIHFEVSEKIKSESLGSEARAGKLSSPRLDAPISPPGVSRSRLRQSRGSSFSSQNSSRDPLTPARLAGPDTPGGKDDVHGLESQDMKASSTLYEDRQVVSLLSSSPEPEPEYTEMYADDSIDGDYGEDSLASLQASKRPEQLRRLRTRRGESVPLAASREETVDANWVAGSQGPSRKASVRFGAKRRPADGL